MAEAPRPPVTYGGDLADRGARVVAPPPREVDPGDDFDWHARAYDAIRLSMIEELAARLPAHSRWSPADLEVVLVEVLSAALDQLADMSDRVSAEAVLETARRPESVRRLLQLIGYDAALHAGLGSGPGPDAEVERLWTENPAAMERARREGPLAIHTQRRMVSLADFGALAEAHPVVARASARAHWSGAWNSVQLAVLLRWPGATLDMALRDTPGYNEDAQAAIERHHAELGLPPPAAGLTATTTHRMLLDALVEAFRLAGQPVTLLDAVGVGVEIGISVEVVPEYFRSELRQVLAETLGTGPGGHFEPGRLRLGEDLHASDLYQRLLSLEGVASARLTRLKRYGAHHPDHAGDGLIRFDGLEVPVCDNDRRRPERGHWVIDLHGGRLG